MTLFKNIKYINRGSTRLVLLIGKYAIKFPRGFSKLDDGFYGRIYAFLNGWSGNRHEYIWSKSGIHDFLMPVRYSFLWSMIIVMDRGESLDRDEFFNLDVFNFGYEHKIDSMGKVDGKVYVLDYG